MLGHHAEPMHPLTSRQQTLDMGPGSFLRRAQAAAGEKKAEGAAPEAPAADAAAPAGDAPAAAEPKKAVDLKKSEPPHSPNACSHARALP